MKAPLRNEARDPLNVSNIMLQWKCGFEAWENDNMSLPSVGSGDIIELDGNANGASYLRISKNPLIANSETQFLYNKACAMPLRYSAGVTTSQNIAGQDLTSELVGVDSNSWNRDTDAAPSPVVISSLSQATTTLTVNTTNPHGLVVGDRVDIYGCVDSRFNYTSCIVATTPTTTQFTVTNQTYAALPSVTASPAGGAFLLKTGYGAGDRNSFGLVHEGTGASNSIYYTRRAGGTEDKSASVAFITNWKTALNGSTSPLTYTFSAAGFVDVLATFDSLLFQVLTINSSGVPGSAFKRTQNIPDEKLVYQPLFRAKNRPSMTVPAARIVSSTKSGTTTATVVTDQPHGLTTTDYVVIYGNRDQTNFANLTTATAVASVIDATTFTIAYGASFTGSTRGGTVFRVQGNQLPAANAVAIQSIAATSNVLTVVGNTTWTGIAIGELVYLHGVYDNGGGSQIAYEGAWKVANIATTTLTLVPVRSVDAALALGAGKSPTVADIGVTNMGGTVIKMTDYRIHFLRATDYQQVPVDIAASTNRNIASDAQPTYIVGAQSGAALGVSGSQTANSATIVNPVGVGVLGLSANPTVVTTGRWANQMADLMGRPVVQLGGLPQLMDFNRITVSTTTETTLIAAIASVRHCMRRLVIANRDTVACTVDIRDTTAGTVRESYVIPAGQTMAIVDEGGWPQGAVNTNWTVALRAAITTNAVEISSHSYRINY